MLYEVITVAPKLAAERGDCPKGCGTALQHALITPPEARDPAVAEKLKPIIGRLA